MKRKRRKSRLIMDFMELISETTKFLRDAQYLENRAIAGALAVVLMPSAEQEQWDLGCSHSPGQRMTGIDGGYALGYFKYPQETKSSQDTDPKRGSWSEYSPNHLEDASHRDLRGRHSHKSEEGSGWAAKGILASLKTTNPPPSPGPGVSGCPGPTVRAILISPLVPGIAGPAQHLPPHPQHPWGRSPHSRSS